MKKLYGSRFLRLASVMVFLWLFSPFCGAGLSWTDTDAWRIRDAIEKQAKRIVPKNKNNSKVHYEISEYFNLPRKNLLRNEITIFVPPADSPLYHQTNFVRRLIARMLLIRLGYSPILADSIAGHWIVRGMAYGILQTAPIEGTADQSISHQLSIAGVLATVDVFPELESVTMNLPSDLPPALTCWNDEYAWILLQLCRSDMDKKFFSVLLRKAVSGEELLPYRSFAAMFPAMRRKGKKVEAVQQWYLNAMRRKLQTNRNPSRSVAMESAIQTLLFCPVQGKDAAVHHYSLETLPFHEAELKDWRGDVQKQIQKIMESTCFSGPPEYRLKRMEKKVFEKKTPEEMSVLLRQLYAELDDSIRQTTELEEYMDDAEERFVPFESRHARLLHSAQALQEESPVPATIEQLLDKWELSYEK